MVTLNIELNIINIEKNTNTELSCRNSSRRSFKMLSLIHSNKSLIFPGRKSRAHFHKIVLYEIITLETLHVRDPSNSTSRDLILSKRFSAPPLQNQLIYSMNKNVRFDSIRWDIEVNNQHNLTKYEIEGGPPCHSPKIQFNFQRSTHFLFQFQAK